ncbi:MAG: S66 peptidase family protein [Casimicrobium sp.]
MQKFNYPKHVKTPHKFTCLALSGSVDPAHLQMGAARLRERGHEVVVPDAANAEWRYFAGDDDARLRALDDVLASDADVVLFARGGYGLSRILHRIDFSRVAASGKVFCGYSDVTAFSLAALAKANYVTYAGPVLAGVIPNEPDVAEFVASEFFDVLTNRAHAYPECESDVVHIAQTIDGTLWGTNLAMISHLVGTPFMPQIEDGILVIEDISESPYRVERMLWQLKHAGILDRQRAIVLGQFTQCEPSPTLRYPYSMPEVIETLREMVACPVLTGFPFGHVAKKTTLPMGARARLAMDGKRYVLSLTA